MHSQMLLTIGVMAVATFATRLAGPVLMSRTRMSAGMTCFLDGMAVSVVAAIVATALLRGGMREGAAAGVACMVMAWSQSPVLAMVAGAVCAGLWAHLSPVPSL